MTLFRLLLVVIALTLALYTAVVVGTHGLNYLPVYLRDIMAMGWPGQFNLDFGFMLLLAGLWLAWRHDFSAGGLLLPVIISVTGAMGMAVYLLVMLSQTRGDLAAVLLGQRRAAALRSTS